MTIWSSLSNHKTPNHLIYILNNKKNPFYKWIWWEDKIHILISHRHLSKDLNQIYIKVIFSSRKLIINPYRVTLAFKILDKDYFRINPQANKCKIKDLVTNYSSHNSIKGNLSRGKINGIYNPNTTSITNNQTTINKGLIKT